MSPHLLSAAADNILHCPVVAGGHPGTEAVDVIGSVAAEYIRQLDHGGSKIVHQRIDGFYPGSLCIIGQMGVDSSSGRRAVP